MVQPGKLGRIAITIILCCSSLSSAQPYRLFEDLLADYVADLRPSQNASAVSVNFGFSLTQIISIDEKNQIMTINARIMQSWRDYKLAWDPKKYENVLSIRLPDSKVWKPDIILYNNANSRYRRGIMSTKTIVNYDGKVTWMTAGIFKGYCKMDLKLYPFDRQTCNLTFASWSYDGTLVDIHLTNNKGDSSNMVQNSEWQLTDINTERYVKIYSCCEAPFPQINITLTIQRQSMFYVINLILPSLMISTIAYLGFYMPSESGEKVTLGITTLLSMTLFMSMVAQKMPPNSDVLPLVAEFYAVTTLLVTLATALTVFTLNIHYNGYRGKPLTPNARWFFFDILCQLFCFDLDEQVRTFEDGMVMEDSFDGNPSALPYTDCSRSDSRRKLCITDGTEQAQNFQSQFVRVLNRIYCTIERNEERLNKAAIRKAISTEWKFIAYVLDRLLIVLFTAMMIFVSWLIMYQKELGLR